MMDIEAINNNLIYQSNKLIEASYTLTTTEQKIIRLLASMINKEDKDLKTYEFETKDLIKLLNTSKSRFYRDIDEITDKLMKRIIKIKDVNTNDFIKYHWVDVVEYKNGILRLRINKDLKDFYISLDQYTKYQLKNILKFKSSYTFRIYEILKQYEKIGKRIITVDNLRIILDIGKQYPKYSNLNQRVIKVAVEEINNNSDLFVEYEPVDKVRKVTAIKFTIHTNKTKTLDTIDVVSQDVFTKAEIDKKVEELNNILSIINNHKISKTDAKKIYKAADGDVEKIKKCYEYTLTQNVDNVVAYMIQICKDFSEPISNKSNKVNSTAPKNKFMNFPQRTYDFEAIEKMDFERNLRDAKNYNDII